MIVVGNRPTQDHFSKVSIYNFSGLKKYIKGVYRNDRKIYLETFEKCPGMFCFPLLMAITNFSENNKQTNGEKKIRVQEFGIWRKK